MGIDLAKYSRNKSNQNRDNQHFVIKCAFRPIVPGKQVPTRVHKRRDGDQGDDERCQREFLFWVWDDREDWAIVFLPVSLILWIAPWTNLRG
jgi:hypothetical protein